MLGVGLSAVVGAMVAVTLAPPVVQELLYDSRASGVTCDELPTREEVTAALDEHADLVRAVEAVGDQVDVVASSTCASRPDRAEVVIFYAGGDDRGRIEELLADRDLGAPVSLRNA